MKKIMLPVLVICGLMTLCSGSPMQTDGTGKTKPFVNSNFVKVGQMVLHYRIWPAAAPNDTLPWLLMVHGMGGSTFSWENNAPALAAAGYQVIAVDVPPFGYSGKDPDFNQSVDNRSELLWKFLNLVHPRAKWNLIGHSMGGGIVQCMAITNPGQVEKVVFADPALFNNTEDKNHYNKPILGFRPVEWIVTGLGRATMIRPKRIAKMLGSAYGREPDPIDVSEYFKALSQKGFARALIRSSAKSKPIQPVDGKSFNKPAIAIWGDKDTWVPLEKMQPLIENIPSIKVMIIEGAGHCPMVTHAEEFNREVIRFMKE